MRRLLLYLITALLLNGCAGLAPATPAPPPPLRVGLVTAPGPTSPATFNALAITGAQQAVEGGGTLEVREAASPLEIEAQLQALAAASVQHFVVLGPAAADPTALLADRQRHLTFSIVDFSFDPALPNAQGLVFREDQAAYLAGALAGLVTHSQVIGVVAGRDVPRTRKYANGFAQGIHATCPACRVLIEYAGGEAQAGERAALAQIEAGADILFGVDGAAGEAALRQAAGVGAWVIGAETDAYLTLFDQGAAPGAERVLTSAIKRVDVAVQASVSARRMGTFAAGTLVFDASNGGLGLAPFHEAEGLVTDEMRARLGEIEAGLAAGTLDTGVRFDTGRLKIE